MVRLQVLKIIVKLRDFFLKVIGEHFLCQLFVSRFNGNRVFRNLTFRAISVVMKSLFQTLYSFCILISFRISQINFGDFLTFLKTSRRPRWRTYGGCMTSYICHKSAILEIHRGEWAGTFCAPSPPPMVQGERSTLLS